MLVKLDRILIKKKKLREIVTETIIPNPVYEEKSTQILECV